MSGVQKVAIFMIALGVEKAAMILKELKDEEVEKITLEIARLENVGLSAVEEVNIEFYKALQSKSMVVEGGMDYARNVLNETKGRGEARGLMKRLENKTGNDTFGLFQANDTGQIVKFLENEQPQIAAVILAHLKPSKAAEIISKLDDQFRTEVSYRMARLGQISSTVIEEIEEAIREMVTDIDDYEEQDPMQVGAEAVANMLGEVDIATERSILENIEQMDPELAEQIKKKMFLFENLGELEDRDLQVIIGEVQRGDLVMALKGQDEQLLERIVENMSSRAKEMFMDDMEASGSVHKKQVEEAQQKVVSVVKKLEREGQITTRKPDPEDLLG
jgi:flagellar motor switch protein FliG